MMKDMAPVDFMKNRNWDCSRHLTRADKVEDLHITRGMNTGVRRSGEGVVGEKTIGVKRLPTPGEERILLVIMLRPRIA